MCVVWVGGSCMGMVGSSLMRVITIIGVMLLGRVMMYVSVGV